MWSLLHNTVLYFIYQSLLHIWNCSALKANIFLQLKFQNKYLQCEAVLHCIAIHWCIFRYILLLSQLNVFLCFKSSSHDKYLQCEFYCIFRTGLQLLDPNIRLHFSFKIFALSCSRIFGSFSVFKANVFLQFQFPG